jgi:poly(hydroxyalkanoate) depolymerase family esterase
MKNPFFARYLQRSQRRLASRAGQAWRRALTFKRIAPPAPSPRPAASAPAIPPGFHRGTYHDEPGQRSYKLFIPKLPATRPMPLLVMLHGCTQDPDDFATGTRMNMLAQQRGFLVLYPLQPARFNAYRCWNWFLPEHQRRDAGEPALIAGMTRHVMKTHAIDDSRVYVAGLSAGGAMAAILGQEYPELYAAIGVHSGLAQGAAHSVASALNAMKHGKPSHRARETVPARAGAPAIVFHGDADATVHPLNAQHLVENLLAPLKNVGAPEKRNEVDAGRRFTRSTWRDGQGRQHVELWEVHGAGHAWSGGHPPGSHTDPSGPDASREMLRFFDEHPRRITR